jgi:hypothetical protein
MIQPSASRSIRFPRHRFGSAFALQAIGQLSPDGTKYWDSQRWVPALSSDGTRRWNGKSWVPADPPNQAPEAAEVQVALAASPGFFDRVFELGRRPRWKAAIATAVIVVFALTATVELALGTPDFRQQTAGLTRPLGHWPVVSWPRGLDPSPAVVSARLPSSSPRASSGPRARPAQTQSPPPTCGAPANPFGYDFCPPADLIYKPAPTFCQYFNCIRGFWIDTSGYVEECADGGYSHLGGHHGACAHHGGNRRPLYA